MVVAYEYNDSYVSVSVNTTSNIVYGVYVDSGLVSIKYKYILNKLRPVAGDH